MASIILRNPGNSTYKNPIDLDNWRAFGVIDPKTLYFISRDFSSYIVNGISIKKFLEICKFGLDVPAEGRYVTEALSCEKCLGGGITDWVSKATGIKYRRHGLPDFIRERNSTLYIMSISLPSFNTFTLFLSRANTTKEQEHCPSCGGTGLYMFSTVLSTTPIEKVSTARMEGS